MSLFRWVTWPMKLLFIRSIMEGTLLWRIRKYQSCLNYPPGLEWNNIHVWFGHIATCVPLV
eukprot:12882162-Prorocentrum_lima.AAC.1